MRVDFSAGPNDDGRRMEAVVRRLLPNVALARLHKSFRAGDIRLNGAKTAPEARVVAGDIVSIWDKLVAPPPQEGRGPRPTPPPLDPRWLVYESPDWLILNKPSGTLVQGGPAGEPSLDQQVRAWLAPRLGASLSFRPGPLHRLDRPTSGLVVFSVSLRGAQDFSQALDAGRVRKSYWALLQGRLTGELTMDAPLLRDEDERRTEVSDAGKAARTTFTPLHRGQDWTWARVNLEHGRTHQIRAHAAQAGFPLWGDTKYGGRELPPGGPRPWILHARQLDSTLFPRQVAPLDAATLRYLEKSFKLFLEGADQFE